MIVGDMQRIFDQQLRPHPIHLLCIIIKLLGYIIIDIIMLSNLKKWGPSQPKPEMILNKINQNLCAISAG
jgi:hypothetical protein